MARRRKESYKEYPDKIIRIAGYHYDKLSELKGKLSYNEYMDVLLPIAEAVHESDNWYVVGDKMFSSLAEARGAAIMLSVETNTAVEAPLIMITVGRDNLL